MGKAFGDIPKCNHRAKAAEGMHLHEKEEIRIGGFHERRPAPRGYPGVFCGRIR
jgi:hypothetical protein